MDKRREYYITWTRRLETLCAETGMVMIYGKRKNYEFLKEIKYPDDYHPEKMKREEVLRSRNYVPWNCRLDRIIP